MTPSTVHDLPRNGAEAAAPPAAALATGDRGGLAPLAAAALAAGTLALGAAGGYALGRRATGARASAPPRQVRRWRRRATRRAVVAGAKRAPRAARFAGRHVRVR